MERLLRMAAIGCTLLVAAGWFWFAADETNAASQQTQEEIAGRQAAREVAPDADQERSREQVQGAAHEFVDDANDVLLMPFTAVTQNNPSEWARRTGPALLALLAYGFGLGLLSRAAGSRGL